jgi:hypothetical protein
MCASTALSVPRQSLASVNRSVIDALVRGPVTAWYVIFPTIAQQVGVVHQAGMRTSYLPDAEPRGAQWRMQAAQQQQPADEASARERQAAHACWHDLWRTPTCRCIARRTGAARAKRCSQTNATHRCART